MTEASGQGPTQRVRLTEIEFRGYKALRRFNLNLKRTNILVGPNNYGKSTIIGALRLLASALRKTKRRPEWLEGEAERRLGWEIVGDSVPISLENVHTDYSETDTTVTFKFSNANELKLFFPSKDKGGGCRLIPEVTGNMIRTSSAFQEAFPFKLAVIPVLGAIEHNEEYVEPETVERNLTTHRAARNFRNYWYHNRDGFEEFAELIRTTWPRMDIKRPYIQNVKPTEVFMFVDEDRIPRELYWCGYGFQIWCQLLTHISRNRDADLLVVDEPEVYLHPDVQRQLLGILRDAGPAVLLATHSTEIMAEAEPSEIVVVDKERSAGRRLANADAVQTALAHIGSIHNITLVQVAKNRRILYVEDPRDYAVLKRLAKVLGLSDLATNTAITALASGGYGSWKEIVGVAKRIEDATGNRFHIAAVYDRDYRGSDELDAILDALKQHLNLGWILEWKEIENYLLNPDVLDRVVAGQMRASGRQASLSEQIGSAQILAKITDPMRHDVLSQYLTRHNEYVRGRGVDLSIPTAEKAAWFDQQWVSLDTRLRIVPGKRVLRAYRGAITDEYSVSFSDVKLAETFKRDEIAEDMRNLLLGLDAFSRKE